MIEVISLVVLALVYLCFATIQDLRTKEVADWLNFSLIIFALGLRFFYCLFEQQGFNFLYQGLIGLAIFFVLGNLLYYARVFAGGDAKLMVALGAVLPLSQSFAVNLKIFVLFFLIFLFVGAVYGIIISIILGIKNSYRLKKSFHKKMHKEKKLVFYVLLIGLVFFIFGLVDELFFALGILVLFLPFLYFYTKSVEEVCLVQKISTRTLVEGDWIYHDLKFGKKIIKADWNGLTNEQISIIKKNFKRITIKQGIAFIPVFLISFLILYFLFSSGFLEILWGFLF